MLRTVLAALLLSAIAATPSFAEDVTNNARIVCDGNEKNRDIYLRMWKILFMDRAGERAAEFYAPQVVSHNSDAGGPGRLVSPDDMAKMWEKSKQVDPGRVLEVLLAELSVRQAAALAAKITGVSRSELYQLALRLK